MSAPLLRRLAPLLALVALTVSACSTIVDSPAATVDGARISDQSLQDELELIRDNEPYRQALEQSYGSPLAGAGQGTFDTAFVAQLLSLRIYYELLEQELAGRGVEVTDAEVAEARASIEQQLATLGDDVVESFPDDYLDRLGRQQALVEAAADAVAAEGQSAEEFFEENRERFVEACVSHILVSAEPTEPTDPTDPAEGDEPAEGADEAEAEAQAIRARIGAGEDFAEVAAAESDDPGSAEEGGDLGCGPRGRFVAEFDDAVFELPVGELSEPVRTDFGWHLILVTSRDEPTFADVEAQVEQQLRQGSQEDLNQFLLDLTCAEDLRIDVNPRYGTWDRTGCESGLGLARVVPPERPSSGPAPTADLFSPAPEP